MKAHFHLLGCLVLSSAVLAADKPNVVVILVDDMGFSDLGCYGSEIPTPNLDALAANGLRFTQFYNTGRCCPTRAALLTGLYSHQAGVGHMVEDQGAPGYRGRLMPNAVTFAQVLKTSGYFTAMAGKWHVGMEDGATPWERGFDRSLNAAAGGFYYPDSPRAKLFLNGESIANDDARLPANWYSTDLWTTYGLKFIDEAVTSKKPFLLYLPHNAPHFPLQAPAEEIARFRGAYREGWDALRQRRFERQKQLGFFRPDTMATSRPSNLPAWDTLDPSEKDRFDHIMAVYAAVVSRMDRAIGDLVTGLKQRGVFDTTLLLFMSDNGGNAESGPQGRNEGDPSTGKSDWFCGQSWAHLENTPFQRYKHFNHEGGVATPLIVHWPAGLQGKPGRLVDTPSHLVDIMATLVDVGGAVYPRENRGSTITPMEGRSLVPTFGAEVPVSVPRDLFWEHEGNAAVRSGDWKLVRAGRGGSWEMYDMCKDRTELHDLSGEQPERALELASKWNAWAERAQVLPYPGGKMKSELPSTKGNRKSK